MPHNKNVLTNKKIFSLSLISLLIILTACTSSTNTVARPTSSPVAAVPKSKLKIGTFQIPTPTPQAEPGCNHDNGQPNDPSCYCPAYMIECKDKKCVKIHPSALGPGGSCDSIGAGTADMWCASSGLAPTDGIFCIGKPVVYLYPPIPMHVSVQVETRGQIIASIPHYPAEGWQNIWTEPSGKLSYQGKAYGELFYETNVNTIKQPRTGVTLQTAELPTQLSQILTKLGLTYFERQEFLDFWLPKLYALKSPYIFFSIIDTSEKNAIDKLVVNPEPDTRIEFLAYFKPVPAPLLIPSLNMPPAPERKGFTIVEWGGTIDTGSVEHTLGLPMFIW